MWRKTVPIVTAVLLLGVAQALAAGPIGQLGWWAFDEGAGTTAKDGSPNGNNGTLMNGAAWADGKFGKAIKLNGNAGGSYVEIPHNPSLCVTNEVTVSLWVNPERTDGPNASGYSGLIAKGSPPRSYNLYIRAAGTLHFSTGPAGAFTGSSSTGTIPLNQWTHIAVKVEGSIHKYFINGEPSGTGPATVVLPGLADTAPVRIGRTAETNREFKGMIDEVRLYDVALTDAQIKDLYNNKPMVWPKAIKPSPADGTVGVSSPLLTWTPGEGALFHDVYVGTKPELTEADKVASRQAFNMYFHIPGLQAGATYYWRVDEIAQDGTVAAGDVWSFVAVSTAAMLPVPPDGDTFVKTSTNLTWMAGQNAITHDVYLSATRADVEQGAAGAFKGNQKTASLPVDGLTPDAVYYWRVDEINLSGAKQAGAVWQFTTRPVFAKTDPNLVGWWKLDNEKAGLAVDCSGYDNYGTLTGNAKFVAGYFGDALAFDGMDDSADCGASASLSQVSSVSVAAWINVAALAAERRVVSNHNNSNGGYKLTLHSTNVPEFEVRTTANGATVNRNVAGGTAVVANTWYHLVGVYDRGKAIRTYVNGKLDRELVTANLAGVSNGVFRIGRESHTAGNWWYGQLDDVRVYHKALTEAEIQKVMQGDTLLAWNPQPKSGAVVDIQSGAALSWTGGEKAVKHDVYFGQDRGAVSTATTTSPVYQGRQSAVSFAADALVTFGGGTYYWRVDEVEADDTTIHKGAVWSFTIPNYLIVDDFEGYTDDEGGRIYETWVDGWTNNTGSTVGNLVAPFAERTILHGGKQAMPMDFNNIKTPFYSEAERAFAPQQNWTGYDVNTLSLWFRGNPLRFLDKGNGAFTVGASGHDIWDNADDFRFVWKRLNGDGSILVKVESVTNTNAWAKAGVMIRGDLTAGSTMAYMIQSYSSGVSFGWRQVADGTCGSATQTGVNAPRWVKLTRTGNAFTAQYSADGKAWTDIKNATTGEVVSTTILMGSSVYIGLCTTSHNTAATTTAQYSGAATTGGVTGTWQETWIGDDRDLTNSAAGLYVAVADSAGKVAVATHSDPAAANVAAWTEWRVPLSSLTGANLARIKTLYIGVGDRKNPVPDGSGRMYIDDIRVIKP
ncbi:MAG: hypothetical protein MUC88_04095 [Planctomycetes bacterium]|jgi:hypothetical protein|nr:hypothetical protein [Planctomycetota bacterium]